MWIFCEMCCGCTAPSFFWEWIVAQVEESMMMFVVESADSDLPSIRKMRRVWQYLAVEEGASISLASGCSHLLNFVVKELVFRSSGSVPTLEVELPVMAAQAFLQFL